MNELLVYALKTHPVNIYIHISEPTYVVNTYPITSPSTLGLINAVLISQE